MKQIISQFVPLEEIGEVLPFGNGHINDTYAVTDREGTRRWILQRINHHIFHYEIGRASCRERV